MQRNQEATCFVGNLDDRVRSVVFVETARTTRGLVLPVVSRKQYQSPNRCSVSQVDDDLLWELFVQAGPVVSVHLPRDSLKENHRVRSSCCERSNICQCMYLG